MFVSMGEFTVDVPAYDDKMGETASQKPALEGSVSFGRFENDSLAWEKWSNFSPNKYMEEVEKCATPGAVAQKKAYFEAHYKMIAARKAELLDQEGKHEKDPSRSDVRNGEIVTNDNCKFDSTLDASNSQCSSTEEVKQETDLTSEVNSGEIENPVQDFTVTTECHNSTVDDREAKGERKDIESRSDYKTSKHEDAVCVGKQEISIGKTQDVKKLKVDRDNDIPKISEAKVQNAKLDRHKESKKVPLANKERDAAKQKKVVSPMHKETRTSAQKAARVTQTPTKVVASGSSTKKVNSPAPSSSRSKYAPTAASKGVPNKSLSMSLNLSASTPGSASPMTTMRKSFILEKMGDKDIVKRVFKTFQITLNGSQISTEDVSSMKKQVPTRGTEIKNPASMIVRKENGRRTKVSGVDKTGVTAVPSTFGSKSNLSTEKTKEAGKEMEMKKVRQNTNFKATPMQGSYQKQKLSQSSSDKGNLKTGIHR